MRRQTLSASSYTNHVQLLSSLQASRQSSSLGTTSEVIEWPKQLPGTQHCKSLRMVIKILLLCYRGRPGYVHEIIRTTWTCRVSRVALHAALLAELDAVSESGTVVAIAIVREEVASIQLLAQLQTLLWVRGGPLTQVGREDALAGDEAASYYVVSDDHRHEQHKGAGQCDLSPS